MKKLLFSGFITLISMSIFAQKIEKSIIDDFTGEKVIYTSWEKIKSNNLTGQNQLLVRFRYENDFQYFELKWITGKTMDKTSGIVSVDKDAKLMLKFSDDKVITLNSVEYTMAVEGAGTTGLTYSALRGMHLRYIGDGLSEFASEKYLTKVRIYTTNGYVDIDLKEKDTKKINKLYEIFTSEIEKPDSEMQREKSSNEDDF